MNSIKDTTQSIKILIEPVFHFISNTPSLALVPLIFFPLSLSHTVQRHNVIQPNHVTHRRYCTNDRQILPLSFALLHSCHNNSEVGDLHMCSKRKGKNNERIHVVCFTCNNLHCPLPCTVKGKTKLHSSTIALTLRIISHECPCSLNSRNALQYQHKKCFSFQETFFSDNTQTKNTSRYIGSNPRS